MVDLKIMRLENVNGELPEMPKYESLGAGGMDLRAFCTEPVVLRKNGGRALIPTGIAVELPDAFHAAFVMARSSLGAKYGVCPSNAVGLIDSDYRGEIFVSLTNHGDDDFIVKSGERIAQLCIVPIVQCNLLECEELSDTERGTGGFGSTGKR